HERRVPAISPLADDNNGLTEEFNHHGDQKVATKLDEISGLWLLGDNESFLSDRIEERSCRGERVRGSSRNNEELTCRSDVWAPKDRRRDETLAGFCMRRRERLRQRDTDRARGDVDPTLRQTINDAAFAEHHAFDGVVVCQHGNNGTFPAGVGDTGNGPCT